MKHYLILITALVLFSCNNQKTLLLPEIENADITEVLDMSAAYIFYDETQLDSTLLNRKNLISTTNWLVNVDKRLSLRQAIPHIKFLQDKKRNAKMHKNENAKNYYSCNDTSIANLGFIEFTKIHYKEENPDFVEFSKQHPEEYTLLKFFSSGRIDISNLNKDVKTVVNDEYKLSDLEDIKTVLDGFGSNKIVLFYQVEMSFQDYITSKHFINQLISSEYQISEFEYLFQ